MSSPDQPLNPSAMPQAAESVTRDDRVIAMLAHVLQIFAYFVGPLIIYLAKRDSRFVRFHALQALIWQVLAMTIFLVLMAVMFAAMFGSIATNGGAQRIPGEPPPMFVYLFPLLWLAGMGFWAITLILGIVYGVNANSGKWSRYPLIGKLAWRWSQS